MYKGKNITCEAIIIRSKDESPGTQWDVEEWGPISRQESEATVTENGVGV